MISSLTALNWRLQLLMLTVFILVIAGGSWFGYRTWYNSVHYVSTNNAQVVADLIQVGSINAGRIIDMNVDTSAPVTEGQLIAVVDIPAVISRSDTTDTTKLGFRDVQDQLVEVVVWTPTQLNSEERRLFEELDRVQKERAQKEGKNFFDRMKDAFRD